MEGRPARYVSVVPSGMLSSGRLKRTLSPHEAGQRAGPERPTTKNQDLSFRSACSCDAGGYRPCSMMSAASFQSRRPFSAVQQQAQHAVHG